MLANCKHDRACSSNRHAAPNFTCLASVRAKVLRFSASIYLLSSEHPHMPQQWPPTGPRFSNFTWYEAMVEFVSYCKCVTVLSQNQRLYYQVFTTVRESVLWLGIVCVWGGGERGDCHRKTQQASNEFDTCVIDVVYVRIRTPLSAVVSMLPTKQAVWCTNDASSSCTVDVACFRQEGSAHIRTHKCNGSGVKVQRRRVFRSNFG